jgi:hypothetical protein
MIDQDYGTVSRLDDNSDALVAQALRIVPTEVLQDLTARARTNLLSIGVQTGIDPDSASNGQVQSILQIVQADQPELGTDDAYTVAHAILAESRKAA